ncbi:MAG: hypothetical protein ACTSQE_10265 [Candidatus Heimdallarchaeaceae archaeon]
MTFYTRRFKIFFTYSIDLGSLINKDDMFKLIELRCENKIDIRKYFDKKKGEKFKSYTISQEEIDKRIKASLKKGGKNIWTRFFIEKLSPIVLKEDNMNEFTPSLNIKTDGEIEFGRIGLEERGTFKYYGCEMRIFPESAISYRFTFGCLNDGDEEKTPYISTKTFINLISKLKEETEQAFKNRLEQFLANIMQESCEQEQENGLYLIPQFLDLQKRINGDFSSYKYHVSIFLEGLFNKENNRYKQENFKSLESMKNLLGILNLANWFEKYSESYINKVKERNIGYRNDEFYITDHNISLILLNDYWNFNTPLHLYMYDLILLIEYLTTKDASLEFIKYAFNVKYRSISLKENLLDSDIKQIIKLNNLCTKILETIEVNSLSRHGFTRKLGNQIIEERNIRTSIQTLFSHIEYEYKSITLLSDHSWNKINSILNKTNLWIVIVSLLLSLIVSFIDFLFTVIKK